MRFVILTTHPIQYQAPLFRELARLHDLTVVFMLRQTPQGQAEAGFGQAFEWDIPLLQGYNSVFAENIAAHPSSNRRRGIVLRGQQELLTRLRPDALVVFGWFPHGYLQMIRVARKLRIPIVCRGESNLLSGRTPLKRFIKFFYFRQLFAQFAAIAYIGQHNRQCYRYYGVPESRLHFAPYSVDSEFFAGQFARHRSASRRPGPWRIGFAGKLISKKRPLDLVAAVARSSCRARLQVVIIGDGPLRTELQNQAQAAGVSLDFRGFLNQTQIVPQGYADLDALVLPSGEYETWGLVVNEAMVGGIPAVVSDRVGCAPDLVTDDATGYRFPSGDVQALTDCLEKLVARLEAGHDFAPLVRERIGQYSLAHSARGITAAIDAAISAPAHSA